MVLEAINQLPLHKTPGDDGFPADWYRAFGKELAPLPYGVHNPAQKGCTQPVKD